MKLSRALLPALCVVVGCASAPSAEPVSSATLRAAAADAPERSAESAAAGDAQEEAAAVVDDHAGGGDPLAMDGALEEASIPIVTVTPAREVRKKRAGELAAALRLVEAESSLDGAASKLTQRLGKPSWTEAPQGAEGALRRIWVVSAGEQCQRLVLEADGSVVLETATHGELRMLSATARQNACTGAIERGL